MKNNEQYVDKLNELIETSLDAHYGYQEAALSVDYVPLKNLLNKFSDQRMEFVNELKRYVLVSGDEPTESGSVMGSLHRFFLDLKSNVSSNTELAVMEECERGEKTAVDMYNKILQEEAMPADMRLTINKQLSSIQNALEDVRALKVSFETA